MSTKRIERINNKYHLIQDISIYGDGTAESTEFIAESLSEIYYYIKLREMQIFIEENTIK